MGSFILSPCLSGLSLFLPPEEDEEQGEGGEPDLLTRVDFHSDFSMQQCLSRCEQPAEEGKPTGLPRKWKCWFACCYLTSVKLWLSFFFASPSPAVWGTRRCFQLIWIDSNWTEKFKPCPWALSEKIKNTYFYRPNQTECGFSTC